MQVIIKNGAGNGNLTKVGEDNRIHADSIVRSQIEQSTLLGDAFNIATSPLTLTNATESALIYIKSENDAPFVIKEILVIAGTSTGGAGDALIEIIKNPSAGTIVDNATPISIVSNKLFSSAITPDGNYYQGLQGYTITDGSLFANTRRSSFTSPIAFDASPIVLEKGNSIAVKYTPQVGNTSQVLVVAITAFIERADFN